MVLNGLVCGWRGNKCNSSRLIYPTRAPFSFPSIEADMQHRSGEDQSNKRPAAEILEISRARRAIGAVTRMSELSRRTNTQSVRALVAQADPSPKRRA